MIKTIDFELFQCEICGEEYAKVYEDDECPFCEIQEKVAEKLGVDPNERKMDEFDVMDFMARIENVISELEERAKRLQDDWELDGYHELVFAITKFKQVIEDEKAAQIRSKENNS